MFSFFNKAPLLPEESVDWLWQHFAWAMANFDREVFFNETILVLPTNKYFSGTMHSPAEMAQSVFDNVKKYAGMSHWACQVLPYQQQCNIEQPKIEIIGALRGKTGQVVSNPQHYLPVYYNPQQVNHPETMIANYAHTLAHYLCSMAQNPPPTDINNEWSHSTELVAIFMGFGIMFANSAFTFKAGCSSCTPAGGDRPAALSELEATYALAIFCSLKEIPAKKVKGFLKSHLRGFFMRAVKQANNAPQRATLLA